MRLICRYYCYRRTRDKNQLNISKPDKIELAVFDMDDTITQRHNNVSTEMLAKIVVLINLGIKVIIITGVSVEKIRERLGIGHNERLPHNLILAGSIGSDIQANDFVASRPLSKEGITIIKNIIREAGDALGLEEDRDLL